MFSGIIESQGRVLSARKAFGGIQIQIEKPIEFSDLKAGDSIATSGVCLTLETQDASSMTFTLGAETLQVTEWEAATLQGSSVNLERSLKFGDRVHGHMVSGHVDALGEVVETQDLQGSLILRIRVPKEYERFIWKKGSWAVNGVSLTVNEVKAGIAEVCLIPETLKRTNLSALKAGSKVNIEVDQMARALMQALQASGAEKL
jgi:riboflavin synthase